MKRTQIRDEREWLTDDGQLGPCKPYTCALWDALPLPVEQVHNVQTVKSCFVICASTESLKLMTGIDVLRSEHPDLSIIVSAQLLQICTYALMQNRNTILNYMPMTLTCFRVFKPSMLSLICIVYLL